VLLPLVLGSSVGPVGPRCRFWLDAAALAAYGRILAAVVAGERR
jgi:hypothetical protein